MGSLIVALIFSLAALALSVAFVVALIRDAAHPRPGVGPFVRFLRWSLRGLALCCAVTAWVVLCGAWYTLATRRLEGAAEASLATRLALYYPALGGAAMVWLSRRIPDHWFRPRYRGPPPPAPRRPAHRPLKVTRCAGRARPVRRQREGPGAMLAPGPSTCACGEEVRA